MTLTDTTALPDTASAAPPRRPPRVGRHRAVGGQRPRRRRLPLLRLRLPGHRLRGPGDGLVRPGVVRPRAGPHPLRGHGRPHPRLAHRRPRPGARRRRPQPGPGRRRRRRRLPVGGRPGRPGHRGAPHRRRPPRPAPLGQHRHLRRDPPHVRRPLLLPGGVPARLHHRRPAPGAGRPGRGPQPRRPRGRQRGAGRPGAVGRLLPLRPRLRPSPPLRRLPDLHRVLGPHVHRGVGRQPHRPAPQRAGQGPPQEPDPGVHRDLPGTGRAAHRPPHRRHRRRRWRPSASRGVRFLEAPATYYDDVRRRLGHLDLPWDDLQRLGILVDEEPDGWLLQIFTETITDRPTVFLEIIQRGGAKGFGAGNFKALFEAIEREQARRGHL